MSGAWRRMGANLPSSEELAADLWFALYGSHPEARVHTVGSAGLLVTFPDRPALRLSRVEARGILKWLETTEAKT